MPRQTKKGKPSNELAVNRQVLGTRSGIGWRLLLTDDLADAIITKVAKGMPYALACNMNGISQSTGANWLQRGEEEPDGTFGPFSMAIRKAQAEFVERAIDGIVDAGLSDAKQWTALMTILERVYPDYFRRPSEKGGDITINNVIGVVEGKVHQLHEAGEIQYDGG